MFEEFTPSTSKQELENSRLSAEPPTDWKGRLSVELLVGVETPEKTGGLHPEQTRDAPIRLQGNVTFTSPIVIVDEESALVHDMVEYLGREFLPFPVVGHSVSRAAAAMIARERPLVLVCSLQMPRVGGVDLITLARKRWGNLPTVILVGSSGPYPSESARVSGDTIYLEKPFRIATLCERIAELRGMPPRDLRAPLPGTVLVDAEQLAAGREQGWELPSRASPGDHGTRSVVTQEPPIAALVAGLAANDLVAEDEVAQDAIGGTDGPDWGGVDLETNHSMLQAVSLPTAAVSLSSETPLPLPSHGHSGESGEYQSADEIQELLDDEIEIIEYKSGHLGPDNDRNSHEGEIQMALTTNNIKENLTKLEGIEGFVGAALADSDSGMCLGYLGGSGIINLEIAAAANTEVVRSKRKAIKALNLRDEIEDILISLGKQYHLVRPVKSRPNLFFYLVLDRQRANLAMARFSLADAERELPM